MYRNLNHFPGHASNQVVYQYLMLILLALTDSSSIDSFSASELVPDTSIEYVPSKMQTYDKLFISITFQFISCAIHLSILIFESEIHRYNPTHTDRQSHSFLCINQEPVVQSIVSLTISLRHKFVKQISAKVTNTLIFC